MSFIQSFDQSWILKIYKVYNVLYNIVLYHHENIDELNLVRFKYT